MKNTKILLSVLFVLIAMQSVLADIPQTISYQGILANAAGDPVEDGEYTMTFRLYDENGDELPWQEEQVVEVNKGIFNVILGSTNPLNLPFDQPYWLGITIGENAELEPRIELTSSAYSLNSRSIADSAVTSSKIADGNVVRSINTLTDSVILVEGDNVTITPHGDSLVISAAVNGGGIMEVIAGDGLEGQEDAGVVKLRIADEGVTTNKLADGAVTGDKIADGQVVRSINVVGGIDSITDTLTLAAGENVMIEQREDTLEISAFGGGEVVNDGDWTITDDNDMYSEVSGNVGIGIMRPTSKLTVAGFIEIEPDIELANPDSVGVIFTDGTIQYTAAVRGGDGHSLDAADGRPRDAVFVDNDGRVGIGTKIPSATVEIFKDHNSGTALTITNPNTGDGASTSLILNTGGEHAAIHSRSANFPGAPDYLDIVNNHGAGSVISFINNGSESMRITDVGNVGIAKEDPQAKLHIGGLAGIDGIMFPDETFQATATKNYALDAVDGTPENVVYVDEAGNVGIGTIEPTAKLDVAGTIRSGSTITIDGSGENNRITATDNLELHVDGERALRLETNDTSPNFIGGHSGNSINQGIMGATIGGGGRSISPHSVRGNFGTVSGGVGNIAGPEDGATVGGGAFNRANNQLATVSGGSTNEASGANSTIGGGSGNTASGQRSTIGGGDGNTASLDWTTVGGGLNNIASDQYAVVPGGWDNTAAGYSSFAAGLRAKANHNGAFVWSDATVALGDSFASTAPNQFLINAAGGVGINTNNPGATLHIGETADDGIVDGIMFSDGTVQTTAGTGDGHSLDAADGDPMDAVFVDNDGNVGIGTTNPEGTLHISDKGETQPALFLEGASDDEGDITWKHNQHLQLGRWNPSTDTFTEDMRITYDGNVGIGTTSPGLVKGADKYLSISTAGVPSFGSSQIASLELKGASGLPYGPINRISFLAHLANNEIIEAARIETRQAYDPNEGELLFFTNDGGTLSEKMKIDKDGNIGIGTTNPGNNLHILSHTNPGFVLQNPDFPSGLQTSGMIFSGLEGSLLFGRFNDEGTSMTRTDLMIKSTNGNIGIGTTSPESKLEVFYDNSDEQKAAISINNVAGSVNQSALDFRFDDEAKAQITKSNHGYLTISTLDNHGIMLKTNGQNRLTVNNEGEVGIGTGTTIPEGTFHISDKGDTHPALYLEGAGAEEGDITWKNTQHLQIGTWNPSTNTFAEKMRITSNGNVGIGTTSPDAPLEVVSEDLVAIFDRPGAGQIIRFEDGNIYLGSISVSAGKVSYNPFTGSHLAWTYEVIEHGMLVSLTGINRNLHDNPDSEIIYGVVQTTKANDPKILGSYLSLQEPNKPASLDNPHLIMAVGNGEMWVVDSGEDIRIGDFLISSDIPGHAMKDRGDYDISFIVARTAEAVDWSNIGETINKKKHKKISVFFESFVRNHALDKALVELHRTKVELNEFKSKMAQFEAALQKLEAMTNKMEKDDESGISKISMK